MRFRRFGAFGFAGSPAGFQFFGPMGFGARMGFGRRFGGASRYSSFEGVGFEERPEDARRNELKWLRRYKEDLEEELLEVEARLKELERQEAQASTAPPPPPPPQP
jgi:hypothetical protein